MPVTVVVGGQFGSEGKGKVAHLLAQETEAKIVVRVGGINAGHTVIDSSGVPLILQQLPTSAILPDTICVLSAGSYIKPEILLNEIVKTKLSSDRLFIDPNAVIITEDNEIEEFNNSLRQSIGSTLSGTGAAVIKRISRDSSVLLAKDDERLSKYVKPVIPLMRSSLNNKERIIIEGTQGFGLSLLHSQNYPYVTSRDTTAAGFVTEAGLSPLDVDEIVLVIRAFPIRVSGNSGLLPNETDWSTVSSKAGKNILEKTSVTKAVRRVAYFDSNVVKQAIMVNRPTKIVMNHLDYIKEDRRISFVEEVEKAIDARIDYLGFDSSSLVLRDTF